MTIQLPMLPSRFLELTPAIQFPMTIQLAIAQ